MGEAACKNRGGKGVPKGPPMCSLCRETGHRRTSCPKKEDGQGWGKALSEARGGPSQAEQEKKLAEEAAHDYAQSDSPAVDLQLEGEAVKAEAAAAAIMGAEVEAAAAAAAAAAEVKATTVPKPPQPASSQLQAVSEPMKRGKAAAAAEPAEAEVAEVKARPKGSKGTAEHEQVHAKNIQPMRMTRSSEHKKVVEELGESEEARWTTHNERIFGEEAMASGSCVVKCGDDDDEMHESASKLSAYCSANWTDDHLQMKQGNRKVALKGFSTFGHVSGEHDTVGQGRDTAMVRKDKIEKARDAIDGLAEVERKVLGYAQATRTEGTEGAAQVVGIDFLRSRPAGASAGTSEFSVHLDTWSFETEQPDVTYVVSLGPKSVPMMHVVGAAENFDYGNRVGTTASFPSNCAHQSMPNKSSETSYKVTFFLKFQEQESTRWKKRGEGESGSRLSSQHTPSAQPEGRGMAGSDDSGTRPEHAAQGRPGRRKRGQRSGASKSQQGKARKTGDQKTDPIDVDEGAVEEEVEKVTLDPAQLRSLVNFRLVPFHQTDQLTGADLKRMLRHSAGECDWRVVGNGTCWLYAALASLGVLEHNCALASDMPGAPTERDLYLTKELLKKMQSTFTCLRMPMEKAVNNQVRDHPDLAAYKELREHMLHQNVWTPSMGTTMAKWGGELQMALLSRTLERTIVVLNAFTLEAVMSTRNAEKAGWHAEQLLHHVHRPTAPSLPPRMVNTLGALSAMEEAEAGGGAIVVVHSHNHYDGRRRLDEAASHRVLPDAVLNALRDYESSNDSRKRSAASSPLRASPRKSRR